MLTTNVLEKSPGCFEIVLEGRLDTETCGKLQATAGKLLENRPLGIRLNMAKIDYISSMGLRVVLRIAKELRVTQRMFQLTNLKPQIRKVFDIAATLPADVIFASVEEADAYFDEVQRRVVEGEDGPAA